MSTVYSTQFDSTTRECTGPSVDSGFTSFDQVEQLMGKPDIKVTDRQYIYGTGKQRVLFSGVRFKI